MRYPKMRELKEAVISLFTPAYTSSFPAKPHVPYEKYRGRPVVDNDNCVGCETCRNVCPPHAITISDDPVKHVRTITRDYGKCIFCGLCEEHCITGKGVALSDKIFDMAVFDRNRNVEVQEKDLVICRNCGSIITTSEHLDFLHRKLGPKAFSSVLDLNMLNRKLEPAENEKTEVEISVDLKRKDMFNIICPNCLRQVLVKYVFKSA